MREINFRAWEMKMEKYFPVYAICFHGNPMVTIGYNPVEKIPYNDLYVEQFTGLHDKNGEKIYEGDIVKVTVPDEDSCCGNTFEYLCTVAWQNGKEHNLSNYIPEYPGAFCLISKQFYHEQALFSMRYTEIEIIGNIHEGVTND